MCTSTSVISTPGNQRCTLAFRLHSTPSSIFVRDPIFVILKFKCAHLKFLVYGRKQTNIHTHVHNGVTLVWGSLRLAPMMIDNIVNIPLELSSRCWEAGHSQACLPGSHLLDSKEEKKLHPSKVSHYTVLIT